MTTDSRRWTVYDDEEYGTMARGPVVDEPVEVVVLAALTAVEGERDSVREVLKDLVEAIEAEFVQGTCSHDACHWPAAARAAALARDELDGVE